jgi:hypothetical protein
MSPVIGAKPKGPLNPEMVTKIPSLMDPSLLAPTIPAYLLLIPMLVIPTKVRRTSRITPRRNFSNTSSISSRTITPDPHIGVNMATEDVGRLAEAIGQIRTARTVRKTGRRIGHRPPHQVSNVKSHTTKIRVKTVRHSRQPRTEIKDANHGILTITDPASEPTPQISLARIQIWLRPT